MSDSTFDKNWAEGFARLLLFLCFILLLIPSRQAYAIAGNVNCSASDSGQVNLGTVTPGQRIEVKMSGTCRIMNATYTGAVTLSHEYRNMEGQAPKFQVTTAPYGLAVPELPLGSKGGICLNNCYPLGAVGQSFSYDVLVSGTAPTATGRYKFAVYLATASMTTANRADYIAISFISYTVAEPPCSIGTADTLLVPFGSITSSDLGAVAQPADITVNCVGKGALVTAQLSPTLAAVAGKTGVSKTSLDGLSMAVAWADNNSPVVFNSPRSLLMKVGTNTIGFKFQPQLNGANFPTGMFFSQYTFNLTYY